MVSANVLYMIWEQIVFQEKRIFLFTPAGRSRAGLEGVKGLPRAQSSCGDSVGPGG